MDLLQIQARELDFAVWHRAGPGRRLLFIHATGFHSRVWDQVVARLPDFDCWLIDMRGHGQSSKPEPPYVWRDFGLDIKAIIEQLDLRFDLAVGHSMGGHSLALAASLISNLAKSMILIDPIIVRRDLYKQAEAKRHPVERRRNHWQSWQQMFERYYGKSPFDTWDKMVLEDYCRYGLLPATTGDGYELACPPKVEGSIYNNSMDVAGADIYDDLAKVEARVLILHPPPTVYKKIEDFIPLDLGRFFKYGEDKLFPHLTHFIPMESPDLVAEEIWSLLAVKAGTEFL
jgi:pimeloyl-ACP methyl ester carboxylesterase